ncbi:MAG: hypothetical protein RIC16_07495 [Rhodospirillales bacterium]
MASKKEGGSAKGSEASKPDAAPDLNTLAKEYLDLWQQQLAETARDGTLAKTMSDAVRLMSAGAAQMAANMPQPAGGGNGATGDDSTARTPTGGTADTSGTATTGAAHRDDDGVLDELHRRVTELEERIRHLERHLSRPGPGPR